MPRVKLKSESCNRAATPQILIMPQRPELFTRVYPQVLIFNVILQCVKEIHSVAEIFPPNGAIFLLEQHEFIR